MIVLLSAFYQHVVNLNLDIPSDLMCKHLVYEPLKHCACVFKAEWHHFEAKEALAGDK